MATRTNLITNPSFETGLGSWNDYNGSTTGSRDTAKGKFGSSSLHIVSNGGTVDGGRQYDLGALPAGQYAFSIEVETGANVTNAHAVLRSNADFQVRAGGHVNDASKPFQRLTGVFTANGTDTFTILVGLGSYGAASAGEAWFDAVMLEKITDGKIYNYFDGDTVDDYEEVGNTYEWSGVPHASTSVANGTFSPSALPPFFTNDGSTISTPPWNQVNQGGTGEEVVINPTAGVNGGAAIQVKSLSTLSNDQGVRKETSGNQIKYLGLKVKIASTATIYGFHRFMHAWNDSYNGDVVNMYFQEDGGKITFGIQDDTGFGDAPGLGGFDRDVFHFLELLITDTAAQLKINGVVAATLSHSYANKNLGIIHLGKWYTGAFDGLLFMDDIYMGSTPPQEDLNPEGPSIKVLQSNGTWKTAILHVI